jgi:hypothetical protein
MRDALKALIEARNLISLFILKNPTPGQLAEMRWLDRLMAQKIRRPKTDKEEARELIRRLEALISDEAAVVSGLESGEETKPEVTPQEPETDMSLPQKAVTSDPKSADSDPAPEESKEK